MPAGTLAVRFADLRVHGSSVRVGGKALVTGEHAVFCRPVVTVPAFVRRDGTVLADAWLPDLVRLGELEAHLGGGVIEDLVAEALATGRLPRPVRRRIMSYPLVIRLMIAMTLMLDASYCEAMSRLAGLLAGIPFTRGWHVPAVKVITGWRMPVPPSLMEAGIALPFQDSPDRGWLPDGSRMTWLNAPSGRKADRLPVRAAEHNAVFPAGRGKEEVSETCTVITTLLDHQTAPADQVRDAYLTRWSSCETTFGEDKATITGAGNRNLRPGAALGAARGWSSPRPGPGSPEPS
jgi:hypothetical protein